MTFISVQKRYTLIGKKEEKMVRKMRISQNVGNSNLMSCACSSTSSFWCSIQTSHTDHMQRKNSKVLTLSHTAGDKILTLGGNQLRFLPLRARSHSAIFLIATVILLIATNGLYGTQWKCSHFATATASPTCSP